MAHAPTAHYPWAAYWAATTTSTLTHETCAAALHHAADACAHALHHATYTRPLAAADDAVHYTLAAAASASTYQLVGTLALSIALFRQYWSWLAWISLTCLMLAAQGALVMLQAAMIGWSVGIVSLLSLSARLLYLWTSLRRWYRGGSISRRVRLRRALRDATSWGEWAAAARELDSLDGKTEWREEPPYNGRVISSATTQLRAARAAGDADEVTRLLSTMMQRNVHQVNDPSLHCSCRVGTKRVVEEFVGELGAAIRWLAALEGHAGLSTREKLALFERFTVCIGHTALCLSGGGALAMYHLGVVDAMIRADALPPVISGTSGGAIIAGVLAIYTDAEMLDTVIRNDISTRFPERWFPPLGQQLYSFFSMGCLVRNDDFAACTRRYFGDITFEEAFKRTGRIVNINISASSRGGASARGALLLNALTAPHVLIRSAVHASCCLPTVMKPTTLLAKDAAGRVVPFSSAADGGEDGGGEWMDGSFTADIPRDRLSELFHVTQTVVSQVNPHIAIALSRKNPNHGAPFNALRRLEAALSYDIMSRLQILAKLRLLPAMYGPDLKGLFLRQKYTGDVTILPNLGGPSCLLRMVTNPDPAMMDVYIREGRAATLRTLSHIKHLLHVEQALAEAVQLSSDALRAAKQIPPEPPVPRFSPVRNKSFSQLLKMQRDSITFREGAEVNYAGSPTTRSISVPSRSESAEEVVAAVCTPGTEAAQLRRALAARTSQLRTAELRAAEEKAAATAARAEAERLADVLRQLRAMAATAFEPVDRLTGLGKEGEGIKARALVKGAVRSIDRDFDDLNPDDDTAAAAS